ncbi:hypothetical protein BB560_006302 [Smittium megazygosporum]|nr:hypothetical protein BB560_006302 [Smittium megazygosporum]
MKITITTLILFLSPVFSKKKAAPVAPAALAYLVGKSNQQADLNSVMDAAGVSRLSCVPGYLGLDCAIRDSATMSKLSCYLKGKPGYKTGGLSINNDLENKGIACPKSADAPGDAPAATSATVAA